MKHHHHSLAASSRLVARAGLSIAIATAVLALAACGSPHPDSVFHSRTDFNRDVGTLFKILIAFGTMIFLIVEGVLVFTLIRFRRRGVAKRPAQVHGNTTLEIVWTIIPMVILLFIAIPTIRTTFRTQRKADATALQVEVIGHQWWWEFRYPQYTAPNAAGQLDTVVTANEVYLPLGRSVNFVLQAQDVIHSFWVPSLAGKRDLIPNHTNYLRFTPDSTTASVFNGFCAEYCGMSHANMGFRAFTVSPQAFSGWITHQLSPAAFTIPHTDTSSTPTAGGNVLTLAADSVPAYAMPITRTPSDEAFDESVRGDAARGGTLLLTGQGACLGCHVIRGNPSMVGTSGPNLTHIGSRATIASGMFPNDARHLSLWIKNARRMKPGVLMPTIGIGEFDPALGSRVKEGGLTDQQIADIVAYLQALK